MYYLKKISFRVWSEHALYFREIMKDWELPWASVWKKESVERRLLGSVLCYLHKASPGVQPLQWGVEFSISPRVLGFPDTQFTPK